MAHKATALIYRESQLSSPKWFKAADYAWIKTHYQMTSLLRTRRVHCVAQRRDSDTSLYVRLLASTGQRVSCWARDQGLQMPPRPPSTSAWCAPIGGGIVTGMGDWRCYWERQQPVVLPSLRGKCRRPLCTPTDQVSSILRANGPEIILCIAIT